MVAFLLATAGLWVYWNIESRRRAAAMLAEYRAQGQPMSIEDFHLTPIPDAENAALLLRQAAAAIVIPDDAPASLRELCDDPSGYPEFAAKLIEKNNGSLRLVREARGRSRFFWNVPVPRYLINVTLSDLGPQKDLARLLCITAVVETKAGHCSAAAARLDDALFVAEGIGQVWPCVMTYLVREAVEELTIREIETLLPQWKTASENLSSETSTHAPISALLQRLLEEDSCLTSWDFALQGERLVQIETGLVIVDDPPGTHGVLFSPALRLNVVQIAEQTDAAWQAGRLSNWPQARELLPTYPETASGYYTLTNLITQLIVVDLRGATARHFHASLQRRFAMTALALRLYEAEHGAPASSLEELVPAYLPTVPCDPFSLANEPIRYLCTKERDILYSVGPNGINEGGSPTLDRLSSSLSEPGDLVFYLRGKRTVSSRTINHESTQRVDDDLNEQNRRGNADQRAKEGK